MKKKLNCVLLIDDDEPTNFLSQMIVEEAGIALNIQTATSGETALQYLANNERVLGQSNYRCPELIFLDINMPAMNGWEFLEKYSALHPERQGEIVIIMLTTSLNPDDRARSENMPYISGFENKPLTEEKLDVLLKKYFPDNY